MSSAKVTGTKTKYNPKQTNNSKNKLGTHTYNYSTGETEVRVVPRV